MSGMSIHFVKVTTAERVFDVYLNTPDHGYIFSKYSRNLIISEKF